MTHSMWPHQGETYEFGLTTPRIYDLSDPGTGKTRVQLELIKQRIRKHGGRALIIAPKTLLGPAWGNEIRKFTPELMYNISTAQRRKMAYESGADIVITNTDAVKWIAEQPRRLLKEFHTIVIDEVSDFKHRDSKRSKALKKLAQNFEYRAGLTGTPNSNSVTDFWHQALILDDGERLGTDFWDFRSVVQMQQQKKDASGKTTPFLEWVDKPGAEQAIVQILKDIVVRHEFAVVMPHVPENTEYYVYYDPPSKLMRQYEELRKHAMLMVEDGLVDAVNAAALRTKLLQCAAGVVYGTEGEIELDTARSELIADLVMARKYCVVFYNWKHQRDQLQRIFKARGIKCVTLDSTMNNTKRDRAVAEYQAGHYKVILLHPKTGAHGLTLTRGTSVIWCSPNDRADFMKQGLHRIYRGVQDQETESVMVCARDTLEQKVYENTDTKRGKMDAFLDMIKR